MADEYVHSDPETGAKSSSVMTARARCLRLLGEPPLLEGEERAAYDELLANVLAAVKPTDMIDEMFTVDVVWLEWEVLRLRRLKSRLIRKDAIEILEEFLRKEVDFDFYRDYFVSDLAKILEENLPEDRASSALTMAQRCARDEEDAIDEVDDILDGLDLENVRNGARDRKLKELVKEYARHESDAVALIDELLIGAGKSIDDLMAEALASNLDKVERIDHLTTIAEGRRNASLREIDRRRPVFAETLRRSVQQIEHDELQVIEAVPSKGEHAA